MAVPVDGQLLLLNQPMDGPVPEPIVLGPAQKLDILLDAPDPVRPCLPSLHMACNPCTSHITACITCIWMPCSEAHPRATAWQLAVNQQPLAA